jgi:galactose-1-phosphate uridylyltransferase
MYPCVMTGATLFLDRHYTSLTPYRKHENNMYAVRKDDTCAIRYVEATDNHLVMRPHNSAFPIEVITLRNEESLSDYVVGRVCHVRIET